MGKLFGTDGVRGIANKELTVSLATKIGQAASVILTGKSKAKKPKVLIGTDTRFSGDMLCSALAAGFCSAGVNVAMLGVVPTPAVAFLVKKYGADAAVMVSASHNPYEYNGIKIFQGDGFKLPDELEEKIEDIIFNGKSIPEKTGSDVGRVTFAENAVNDYIAHLKSTVDVDFSGISVALDCANGSASVSAKNLFSSLGATTYVLSNEPDGVNINQHCGSTHIDRLQEYVKTTGVDVGFAFDGDADRMLAVDENGEVVDGDKIIAICADYLKNEGKLKKDTAVVTVMTNMGFYKACEEHSINHAVTKVGDRYVLEEMLKNGYSLGGEQSGHVIFLDYASTGDGQLTALQILRIMKKSGKSLAELAEIMKVYPQTLVNIEITPEGKKNFETDADIHNEIKKAEEALGENGRVLVRLSGTEPLARVMLEGKSQEQIDALADKIAQVIKQKFS